MGTRLCAGHSGLPSVRPPERHIICKVMSAEAVVLPWLARALCISVRSRDRIVFKVASISPPARWPSASRFSARKRFGGIAFGGGTLRWTGVDTSPRTVSLGNVLSTISVDPNDSLQLTGSITGGSSGVLNKTGTGALRITSPNTYVGGTIVTSGTVIVGPMPAGSIGDPIGSGPVTLAGGTLVLNGGVLNSLTQQPLNVTGFSQDVVVERNASNYQAAITRAFDNTSSTAGYVFFENGYQGQTIGLPQNHTFSSAVNSAVSFTLQPYNANNVLLVPTGVNPATMTLANPGAFTELNLLTASANGPATLDIQLNFENGDSYFLPNNTFNDWFTNTPGALNVNGRLAFGDGSIQPVSGFPRLFEYDIPIPAAYQNDLLSSIFFYESNSASAGIFAVSGDGRMAGADPVLCE